MRLNRQLNIYIWLEGTKEKTAHNDTIINLLFY